MIVYKLVRVRNGQLVSWASEMLGDLSLTYEVGKWTEMPENGGPIFAFRSKECAMSCATDTCPQIIWKVLRCEAVSHPSRIRAVPILGRDLHGFWNLHKLRKKYKHPGCTFILSGDTVRCRKIKPITVVGASDDCV